MENGRQSLILREQVNKRFIFREEGNNSVFILMKTVEQRFNFQEAGKQRVNFKQQRNKGFI